MMIKRVRLKVKLIFVINTPGLHQAVSASVYAKILFNICEIKGIGASLYDRVLYFCLT